MAHGVPALSRASGSRRGSRMQALRRTSCSSSIPSEVVAGEVPPGERFRLGGMVVKGSIQKTPGTLDVRFLVTDFKHTCP